MADAKAAMQRLAGSVSGGTMIGDLAWTRLTRWREMLSQVFQNRSNLARLPGARSVQVTFGPGMETAARYMAAWIGNVLEETRVKVAVSVGPEPKGPSLRVELAGQDFSVRLERQDEKLVVTVNELRTCTNMPKPTEYLLMREELGIMRRDAVYEKTLATAARIG
jgi:glucose-6-phosphate dehydrogenase assembly protein OpcA